MSPIVFCLAIIVCVSAAQPLRSEMASEELYPGFPHESAYEEAKQMRNLDSIEQAGNYRQLVKQLDRSAWMRGGTLDSIGGGHLVRDLDSEGVHSKQNDDGGADGVAQDGVAQDEVAQDGVAQDGVMQDRFLGNIIGNLRKGLSPIRNGSNLKNMINLAGKLLQGPRGRRRGPLRRRRLSMRQLDRIGGGHLLRKVDPLGGNSIDQMGGHLDTLGGGHLLRQLDTIGGGHLVRESDNPTNDQLESNANFEGSSSGTEINSGLDQNEKLALEQVNRNEGLDAETKRVRRSEI